MQAIVSKPTVPMVEKIRFPLRIPPNLPSANQVFRQSVAAGLERAAAQEILAPVTSVHRQELEAQRMLQAVDIQVVPDKKTVAYVHTQTEFLRRYLQTHDNVWPVYQAQDPYNPVLRQIHIVMMTEKPTPQTLAVQQEIIRMRQHSQARSPRELLDIINHMMAYGIIPNRPLAGMWYQHSTEEELALGDDLTFAVAAQRVPMKDNPWQIEGMEELADRVNTYNAMRRSSLLFEGLPQTYVEDGMHKFNFPIWTRKEFNQHATQWVLQYPFESDLAPYREAFLGGRLASVYNELSPLEKQSILFNVPRLIDIRPVVCEEQYNGELEQWIHINGRNPVSYLASGNESAFPLLVEKQASKGQFFFYNPLGNPVPFSHLPYECQVEVLMWAWKTHHIMPPQALEVLGK